MALALLHMSSLEKLQGQRQRQSQVTEEESNSLAYSTVYECNIHEKELNLPLGYRFSPHSNELIMHYLANKIMGHQLPANIIREMDVYSCDPQQLPISEFKYGRPNEAYFFTQLKIRDASGHTRRTTQNGYWKSTGKDKQIFCGKTSVGFKKILIFYQGIAPKGIKSSWIMHEFRVDPLYIQADADALDKTINSKIENNVVCKIHYKQESNKQRLKAQK